MSDSLVNKVALVTGAGRGIGRAIALRLAEEGVSLLLAAKTEDDLRLVAREAMEHGVRAEVVPCDLLDQAQLDALAEQPRRLFGRLDILVNNAGGTDFKQVQDSSHEDMDWVLGLNLRALMLLTQRLLPLLCEQDNACVINIASLAGLAPPPGLAAYASAKAGAIAFSEALWEEVRRKGLKVSAICPGRVDNARAFEKHGLCPEDVADAVVYVAASSPRVCPIRIVLKEQLDPNWAEQG